MRKSTQQGMVLLLEVVIGLGIFVMALLFTFGLFSTSHSSVNSTKNLSIASDLAREILEMKIAEGFASIQTEPPWDPPVEIYAEINGVETVTRFTPQVDVTLEGPFAEPNNFRRKLVVVTVFWNEGNDYTRKAQLETYVVE